MKKIREARLALEAEARRKAEDYDDATTPPDKAQRNFTDPDSRIMPGTGGKHFIQAYNAQDTVGCAHQVIVAAEVTNKPVDRGQAEPMMAIAIENTGRLPGKLSADAGYFSSDTVDNLTALGIVITCPFRQQ